MVSEEYIYAYQCGTSIQQNTNMEYIALIVAIITLIVSAIAIIVAVAIAKSQKRISLLEMRLRILDDMDTFVNKVLPRWCWDGNMYPYNQHTEEQVRIVFDNELGDFFSEIDSVAFTCNMLRGDEKHATEKGQCHGKQDYEIEEERIEIEKNLSNRFKKQKERAYKKWIKI